MMMIDSSSLHISPVHMLRDMSVCVRKITYDDASCCNIQDALHRAIRLTFTLTLTFSLDLSVQISFSLPFISPCNPAQHYRSCFLHHHHHHHHHNPDSMQQRSACQLYYAIMITHTLFESTIFRSESKHCRRIDVETSDFGFKLLLYLVLLSLGLELFLDVIYIIK